MSEAIGRPVSIGLGWLEIRAAESAETDDPRHRHITGAPGSSCFSLKLNMGNLKFRAKHIQFRSDDPQSLTISRIVLGETALIYGVSVPLDAPPRGFDVMLKDGDEILVELLNHDAGSVTTCSASIEGQLYEEGG